MASLVADYGESSQESKSEDSDTEPEGDKESVEAEEASSRLPPPAFADKIKNSVFVNPFLEAEIAQYAVLEKHVKMVPHNHAKTTKKICFMFKKGICRFGKKCKFAHETEYTSTPVVQEINNHHKSLGDNKEYKNDSDDDDGEPLKKKKRPGLTRGLIPSKKVMNMYRKQKEKCGK